MKTWHERLDEAINARERTWPDLFEYLTRRNQISKPSVYAWKPGAEKRSTMMNGDNAALVCHWLNISPLWLFYGEGESGLNDNRELADMVSDYMQLNDNKKIAVREVVASMKAAQDAEEAAKGITQQAKFLTQQAKKS